MGLEIQHIENWESEKLDFGGAILDFGAAISEFCAARVIFKRRGVLRVSVPIHACITK